MTTSFELMAKIYDSSLAQKYQLSPSTILVLMCLARHFNQSAMEMFPSHHTLATRLYLNERTITRSINELQEKNLIQVYKKGRKNIYKFTGQFFTNTGQIVTYIPDKLSCINNNLTDNYKNFIPDKKSCDEFNPVPLEDIRAIMKKNLPEKLKNKLFG